MSYAAFYFMFDRGEIDWEQAACLRHDPDTWFPERGESTAEAKRVCLGCPIRDECLERALETGERFGVWGGLSERERRALSAERSPSRPVRVPAQAEADVEAVA